MRIASGTRTGDSARRSRRPALPTADFEAHGVTPMPLNAIAYALDHGFGEEEAVVGARTRTTTGGFESTGGMA
jgi:hypothetical protein